MGRMTHTGALPAVWKPLDEVSPLFTAGGQVGDLRVAYQVPSQGLDSWNP